jgi:hypothetical protein
MMVTGYRNCQMAKSAACSFSYQYEPATWDDLFGALQRKQLCGVFIFALPATQSGMPGHDTAQAFSIGLGRSGRVSDFDLRRTRTL